MKSLALIILTTTLSSFAPDDDKYSLQEANLKGKVRSLAYYNYSPEDSINIDLSFVEWYDEKGNKIATKNYMQNRPVDSIYYSYSAQNKVVEENSVSWKTRFTYDAANKLIATNRYKQEDNFLMEMITFGYGANGKENERQSFYNGVTLNYKMNITNDSGGTQETSYLPDGKIERKNEFHYGNSGNLELLKQFSEFFGVKENRHIVYVYNDVDKQGNWIKRHEFIISQVDMVDRAPRQTVYTVITTRKIEYYP